MSTPTVLRFSEKWKSIFIPFVRIALGYWAFYSLLHVLIFFKLDLGLLDRDDFVLALVWAGVPLYIWMWPRIKNLEFPREGGRFIYLALLALLLALPALAAGKVLGRLVGKYEEFRSVKEYVSTDFCKIEQYYVAKEKARFFNHFRVKGRLNGQLEMSLYVVMPILVDRSDAVVEGETIWYGMRYRATVKNKKRKQQHNVQHFVKSSQESFQKEKEFRLGTLQSIKLTRGGNHYRRMLEPGAVLLLEALPLRKSVSELVWFIVGVLCFQLFLLAVVKLHHRTEETTLP